jgi:tripartite-type tricarboxylate transporter receptor subunit TctC
MFADAPVIAKDVPGFEVVAWFGLFAPRGTPLDLVRRIRDDVAAVLEIPDVRKRLHDIGGEPGGLAQDRFAEMVRNEILRWKKVAVAAGIKPQQTL